VIVKVSAASTRAGVMLVADAVHVCFQTHCRHCRGHSITWSARSKSDCGIVRLSALAVRALIARSNLVG